jgi:UDP-N-acetylmuramoyl-tripeptide--D-alanyl-D-alanine ligase
VALVFLTGIPVTIYREYKIAQAARKIRASEAIFIVVTGSYGKTSVKEYLYSILKTKYNVAKTEKNMNTDIGVALSVLKNLKKNTDYFITEVGAYKKGEIAKICRFVRPTIVVITAFGNQHIDLYGSKEALVTAETEPIDYLRVGGTVYISSDIPEYEKIVKGAEYQVRTVSTRHAADYRAKDVKASHRGVEAQIKTPTDEFEMKTSLLGEHVVSNLLPAIACAMDLGVTKSRVRIAIKELDYIENKLSLHKNKIGATIISDGSNSNLEGFIEAIKTAAQFPNEDKYIVSKGIIELGNQKEESYKKIIKELLDTDIILLTTDPLFANLSKKQVLLFDNESFLKDHLMQYLHADNLLLIEGRFSPDFMRAVKA